MILWQVAADWTAKGGIGGVIVWALAAAERKIKSRGDDKHRLDRFEADATQHNDQLLMQMYEIAIAETKALREEVNSARSTASDAWGQVATLRPMEAHKQRLREALEHICAMATAIDPQECALANRRGLAFLRRCTTADSTLMSPLPADMQAVLNKLDEKP